MEAPKQAAPPEPLQIVQLNYISIIDALANNAKTTGTYHLLINAVLTIAAVIVSEVSEKEVENVLNQIREHSARFRAQEAQRQSAIVLPTQGATQ